MLFQALLRICTLRVSSHFSAILSISVSLAYKRHKKKLHFFISFDLNTNAATLCWPQTVCATQYKKDEKKSNTFTHFIWFGCVCACVCVVSLLNSFPFRFNVTMCRGGNEKCNKILQNRTREVEPVDRAPWRQCSIGFLCQLCPTRSAVGSRLCSARLGSCISQSMCIWISFAYEIASVFIYKLWIFERAISQSAIPIHIERW